jgi:hypothetical protein
MTTPTSLSAKDLIAWADNYNSRFTLPQLLRRLILASGKKVTKLRLPSDEQVSRPNYDGVVQVATGNAWLPSGLSVWEMGVDKRPARKAEQEYAKRNRKPARQRSAATFMFVTPRTWLGRDKWCQRKERGKTWKAVQALDSSDLAEWLDSVPPVAFWAARLLGKRPAGVCDITAHWQNIQDLSTPGLSHAVFLAGRESNVNSIGEWLAKEPEALYLEAESQDEVVDFFCALTMSRPEDARVEEARGVIVETPDAFRDASASTVPLILVAQFEIDPQLIRQAVRNRHHVLAPASAGSPSTQNLIKLHPLRAYETEMALIEQGFEFQRAKRIARECGGSSLVLKRLVAARF